MDRHYRLGISIVAGTLALATALCLARVDISAQPRLQPRAAHDLTALSITTGPFRLTERSGRTITEADLDGRVWVAGFTFTRCPISCPRIAATLRGLQDQFADSTIQLVSLSVDPGHDTPSVLSTYADGYGADRDRWWFLTGPRDDVYGLIRRLGLPLDASKADEPAPAGQEPILHSDRLALFDRGNRLIGYFGSNDREELAVLVERARGLDAAPPAWARKLPTVNALLNGTCGVLLVVGWTLIRRGHWRGHAACMIAAVTVSALFLGCYLTYHYIVGSVPYRGVGPSRLVYFSILLSHTVLAVAVVPLVLISLWRASRRRFVDHAKVAKVALPIWLYVSITGVVIYLMLYGLGSTPPPLG